MAQISPLSRRRLLRALAATGAAALFHPQLASSQQARGTAQIITPFGPISSTRKGRLHVVSQERTFSAPSTNSASFFRA
jgi:hypothetical protein